MKPRRADANQADLVRTWRGMGATVIDVHALGVAGFDALVGWRGRWVPVEIKDGRKPPSARKLTNVESLRQAECERAGLPYHIVATEADALAVLGARRSA